MNKKQKAFLWIGIAVIVVMGLFPPWFHYLPRQLTNIRYNMGYRFILKPPSIETIEPDNILANIDFTRLIVQWIMVAVITAGFIVSFKDSSKL